jgi:regulatory protein
MSSRRDGAAAAFDKAVELLARRPHFAAELRRKLAARGFETAEIEAALERVAGLGYLDERRLAEQEATRLRERKGLSRAGVAAALGRKGADADAIAAATSGLDAEAELAGARAAARRWLAGHRPDRAALARHLERKGWGGHVIFSVLKELVPESTDGPEPG